jgi:hypothetical protein
VVNSRVPPLKLFKSAGARLNNLAITHDHGAEFRENFTKRELKNLRGYDLHYGDVISMLQQTTDREKVTVVHVELIKRIGGTGPSTMHQERITIVAKRP